MARTEQQKQLDDLAAQEQAEQAQAVAFLGPPVTDYGTIAPDIIKRQKVQAMESKMTTAERKQYQGVRASKYGYPSVK